MAITIPSDLEPFVEAKLKSGEFDSADAVFASALTAWQGEEVFRSVDRNEVEQMLLEAMDSPRIEWNQPNVDRILEGLREKYGSS